jgi:uracil-DNA glycosylase
VRSSQRPKPLIVGEAPSRSGDPDTPVEGRIGTVLARYAGLDMVTFMETFDRMNVFDAWPGEQGKGSAFDAGAAKAEALKLHRHLTPGRVVLLLGKRVARAFCVAPDYFVEQPLGPARAYVLPHPSGVNYWHNDPRHRVQMKAFMTQLVGELAAGRNDGQAAGEG